MIGARVRQTRELLGWTQKALAEAAGVAQGRISEAEHGMPVSSDVIDALSQATGFPPAWFEEAPFEEFADGTIRYRKASRTSKRDDRRAVRRLEVAVEVIAKLSATRRIIPVALPHLGDIDVEKAAVACRDAMEMPPSGPVRHLIRATERAGAVVVGLPVELGSELPRVHHHHGVSAWPDVTERPVIGFSTRDPGDRQRHTVAHEIGHLVMHRGKPDNGRDYEREAGQFAGALLMPAEQAREAFSRGVTLRHLAQLKQAWGISIAGLIMRAKHVGAITDQRAESLFKQLSARGWRLSEPVSEHREEPALIPRLLQATYGQRIDWIRAAAQLRVPPHLLRELAAAAERDQPTGADHDIVRLDDMRARLPAPPTKGGLGCG